MTATTDASTFPLDQTILRKSSSGRDFPIVCVGGSAGGLDAYIRLLENLPDDMGVAVVIVNQL
jgi:two-component system chemotaxis response regulator CheB